MNAIGIDYTPAFEQGGGIGRYVRELVYALAQSDDQTPYRLFIAGAKHSELPPTIADNFQWQPTSLSTKWLARIWHRAQIPYPVDQFTGKIDLFHATDFVLPPTHPTTKTLLTVHDLSFVRTPETAAPRLRNYLNHVVPRSIANANHILADSAATKADIIEIYGTQPDKITVLLSAINPRRFYPVTDPKILQSVCEKYNIDPATPYVFSIGTVQPRKNYSRLVEAIHKLRESGIIANLVIAGGNGWLEDEFYHTVKRLNATSFVNMIGFADEDDLAALYSAAVCTSFVSLYEGFGFPVLESMACGTPVITSNVSSLPEVAGDVAPMLNPDDVAGIANALHKIIQTPSYANQLCELGFKQVKQFNWNDSAKQLRNVYNQVMFTVE